MTCKLKSSKKKVSSRGVPTQRTYELTDNQCKVLGLKKNQVAVGCGAMACAFKNKAGKIVKITMDKGDTSALMNADGLRRSVKVFDAYRLKGSKKLDALVVEAVEPLGYEEQSWADMAANDLRFGIDWETATPAWVRKKLSDTCEVFEIKPLAKCKTFVKEYADVVSNLLSRDIKFMDGHGGNLGRRANGTLVALDLGFSGKQKRPRIPALAGALRR